MSDMDYLQLWLSPEQAARISFVKDGRLVRPTQHQLDCLLEYLELMKKHLSQEPEAGCATGEDRE